MCFKLSYVTFFTDSQIRFLTYTQFLKSNSTRFIQAFVCFIVNVVLCIAFFSSWNSQFVNWFVTAQTVGSVLRVNVASTFDIVHNVTSLLFPSSAVLIRLSCLRICRVSFPLLCCLHSRTLFHSVTFRKTSSFVILSLQSL